MTFRILSELASRIGCSSLICITYLRIKRKERFIYIYIITPKLGNQCNSGLFSPLTTCKDLIQLNRQALPGYDKYAFITEKFEPRIAWKEIVANIDKAGQGFAMAIRTPSLDPPRPNLKVHWKINSQHHSSLWISGPEPVLSARMPLCFVGEAVASLKRDWLAASKGCQRNPNILQLGGSQLERLFSSGQEALQMPSAFRFCHFWTSPIWRRKLGSTWLRPQDGLHTRQEHRSCGYSW